MNQPLCVSFYYIIYSKHMYFWIKHFTCFRWRQFSKSWTPSFLPYPCSVHSFFFALFFCVPIGTQKGKEKWIQTPLCVSFYYIIYIVSVCFYAMCRMSFPWRQFSKSWTPSFLPYPCSLIKLILPGFCVVPQKSRQDKFKRYQPLCVSFYYIIYI